MRQCGLQEFWCRKGGNVAIIFSLMLLPIVGLVGASIDVTRQIGVKNHAQSATDAAALAGARMFRGSFDVADVTDAAKRSFKSNVKTQNGDASCEVAGVAIDTTALQVKVEATCDVPTVFGVGISGKDTLEVTTEASAAARFALTDVSMMLDISSSMSPTEISHLQDAAKSAAEIIIGETTPTGGRVAIVPFASGVNAGDFGNAATGRTAGDDPENDDRAGDGSVLDRVCVTERVGADRFTDANPTTNHVGAVITSDFAVDAYNTSGVNHKYSEKLCPDSPVHPLDGNITNVKNAISGIKQSTLLPGGAGATAGHLAIAWSWYTISPNWTSVWTNPEFGGSAAARPWDYDTDGASKVVILMTDGVFDTSFNDEFDSYEALTTRLDTLEDAAEALCASMRAQGVAVYAVQYTGPPMDMLENCADDSDRYFHTSSSADLERVFKEIAGDFMGVGLIK